MKPLNICVVATFLCLCGLPKADANPTDEIASIENVLIFGASGRIGGYLVDEALLRGFSVTGVSRDPARLSHRADRIAIATADILDSDKVSALVDRHDAVIVSVGGTPTDDDPASYIAPKAARSLVGVLESLGASGPRLIFVGNVYTLKFEGDKSLLELGRVSESHPNYAMFYGHQLALDIFKRSDNVKWTVASPPNGLRLSERTGQVRWGGERLLRDADGTPATISPEDFAYAVFEELQQGNYVRRQFNVAR